MANTFTNFTSSGITTETIVYTGPVSTQTTLIGLSTANTTSAAIYVSAKLNNVYLIKDAPVPKGSSLLIVGGDQKVVVKATDVIKITATGTVDVVGSVLQIS